MLVLVFLDRAGDRNRGGVETYALLHEDGELARIINLEELLAAVGRVGNVQLDMSVSTVVGRGCGDAFDNEFSSIERKRRLVFPILHCE